MKKIFITGGAGYCGSRLVPFLLKKNFKITVFDIMYFGKKFLPKHKNLKIIKGDIRDTKKLERECRGHEIFINLSCISNDASFELDKNLSKTINLDAFEPMVKAAKRSGIKRFIYASSSSVYGLSKKKNVKENHPLVPLTLYNKYKGMCEPKLLKHTDKNFTGVIFRPATVCGYAPRLRLDLSVNILTSHAYFKNKILVFGGKQLRPNLHVQDYCDVLLKLISADKKLVQNEIFNVGYQNMSILNIAKKVKKIVSKKLNKKITLEIVKSNDNRSYHINSDKIKNKIKFRPKYSIDYAVNELCNEFKKNKLKNVFNKNIFYNVKTVMKLNAK
jgi:nucleoside-diphosphate-sugar epimerase